ncbi:uncharacterized protein LOC107047733 isoform X2 [Diachasma alloeum]|uniref:uncharacterized protein LOC107047733 isoform X2 n=1 Tax=Diachasma alloeum TaxID=454923 RepID=UPI00073828F1|nr:uncharacterized protein LOC107047733 isoform X2 [Diachasma alloeum]
MRKDLKHYSPPPPCDLQMPMNDPIIEYPSSPVESVLVESEEVPIEQDSSSSHFVISETSVPVDKQVIYSTVCIESLDDTAASAELGAVTSRLETETHVDSNNKSIESVVVGAEEVFIEQDSSSSNFVISKTSVPVDKEVVHSPSCNESLDAIAASAELGAVTSRLQTETHVNINTEKIDQNDILPPTMNLVYLQGKYYSILNASTFDSLVQLMYSAANLNIQYRNEIKNSNNRMLKLISLLMEEGITPNFLEQRARCLVENFPLYVHPDRMYGKMERAIRMSGTTLCTWEKYLNDEPSGVEAYNCPKCGKYTRPIFLEPDSQRLIRQRFRNLQKALDVHDMLYNVQCKNEKCTELQFNRRECICSGNISYLYNDKGWQL